MSAKKFCWHCGGGLWANRGRKLAHPQGIVEVHFGCADEARVQIAEMRGDGVTAQPKVEEKREAAE